MTDPNLELEQNRSNLKDGAGLPERPGNEPPADPRVRAILRRVPRGSATLDIGAVQHESSTESSRNWLHKHLYDRASSVIGIDTAAGAVADLRKQGYNVWVADAQSFDIPDKFDVVVAGEIIEHLSNPGLFLDAAREHLKDDGRLIITTPNAWGACYLKRTLLPGEVHSNEEHTCWYDRRTLRQLLERHNYDIEEHVFVPPPFFGEYLSWVCWNLHLRRYGALTQLAVATPGGNS